MRIVPFHGRAQDTDEQPPGAAWLTELEDSLSGDAIGPAAESWRELREDVRALAPAMSPGFERTLGERILERQGARQPRRGAPLGLGARQEIGRLRTSGPLGTRVVGGREPQGAPSDSRRGRPPRRFPWTLWPRLLGTLRTLSPSARLGLATLGTVGAALVVTLVLVGPLRSGVSPHASIGEADIAVRPAKQGAAAASSAASPSTAGANADARPVKGAPLATGSTGTSSAPGRLQQLAASITLAADPNDVQTTADRVGQLAASDGGFVQSSHVQVQQGSGEASLTLRLPSARLGAGLASLARLAPVRGESQSLQDITEAFDSARRRAADATAERQALLRALGRASTQGQIESLRARLSQNATAISRARSAQRSVSRQATTASVEVTVLGDAHGASGGLSLHRGLHDASRVLIVVAVVLLIGAAVLVPLALLLAAFLAGRRSWLRSRRERALDAS
jgi:hypothetical protein